MIKARDREMHSQAFNVFCRGPSSTKQTIDIGTEFGAGVIETEHRIKADFLKLALAGARSRS